MLEQAAYRAALVMTWLAIAEGLRHRFEVAAQRDLELTSLLEESLNERRTGMLAEPSDGGPFA